MHGSSCELETQVLLSGDMEFIAAQQVQELVGAINEIQRMILALIAKYE